MNEALDGAFFSAKHELNELLIESTYFHKSSGVNFIYGALIIKFTNIYFILIYFFVCAWVKMKWKESVTA